MPRMHRIASTAVSLTSLLLTAPAAGFNVNKSINIDAGSESGARSTVSGSISVGSGAVVNGRLETVNGTIRVDDDAQISAAETVNGSLRLASGVSAGDLSTVNGSISIGERAGIDGSVSTVNGSISLEPGTTVRADLGNVNGRIGIAGAEIGGNLTTVTGDVTLEGETVLRGDLVVERSRGNTWSGRLPKIVIGPGVRIDGEIRLEREVDLYISETAEVGGVSGVMSLDDAVRFSGDRP